MKKQAYKVILFAAVLMISAMLSECTNDKDNMNDKDSGTNGMMKTDDIIGSDSADDTMDDTIDDTMDDSSENTDDTKIIGSDGESDTADIMTDERDDGNMPGDSDSGRIGDAITDISRGMLSRDARGASGENRGTDDKGLFPPETNFGQSSKPGTM